MNSDTENKERSYLDVEEICQLIPHRYPFLMIDRVEDVVPNESATGIKNVTINEPFFEGHFPDKPIMPGVLIVESMAQTAGVVAVVGIENNRNRHVYFMSIESARFRKPVIPGDTMRIKVNRRKKRGNVWKFVGEVYVENSLVAESNFTAMIVDDD